MSPEDRLSGLSAGQGDRDLGVSSREGRRYAERWRRAATEQTRGVSTTTGMSLQTTGLYGNESHGNGMKPWTVTLSRIMAIFTNNRRMKYTFGDRNSVTVGPTVTRPYQPTVGHMN